MIGTRHWPEDANDYADELEARIKELQSDIASWVERDFSNQCRIKELEAALEECAEDMASWARYASEYFQEKHDLSGDIAKYKKILRHTLQ